MPLSCRGTRCALQPWQRPLLLTAAGRATGHTSGQKVQLNLTLPELALASSAHRHR
jgi:hypothetical protein